MDQASPDGLAAAVEALQSALGAGDVSRLENLLTVNFTAVMPVGTELDRERWLEGVGSGTLLSSQKADEAEILWERTTTHGPGIASYTSMRRFRVRTTNRDFTILTRMIFLQDGDSWLLASSQGSMIHDGPLVDRNAGIVGEYQLPEGGSYRIELRGRTLFGRMGSWDLSPIFETRDGYEGPLGRWKFEFHRDENWAVIGMTFTSDGSPRWTARKVT
jgi:hypothetical protein